MNNSLVTILVPCFNAVQYIEKCLDSIRNQTYKNIEILCINDGSTDSTLAKLQGFAALDSRIRIIDKLNTGYGDSMNRGLNEARGDYVGIVESDDFVEKEMIKVLLTTAISKNLDIVRGKWFTYKSSTQKSEIAPVTGFPFNTVLRPVNHPYVFRQSPAIWASLYKRDFLNQHQIRFLPTPGASYQDTSFAFKAYAACERFEMLDKAFIHYRIDNESSSINNLNKVFCICDEFQEIRKFVQASEERERALSALVTLLQFESYRWNFNRLKGENQKRFLDSWCKELRKGIRTRHFYWSALNFKKKRQVAMIAFLPQFVEWSGYVS